MSSTIPADARRRVVVTGLGVVSPVGLTIEDFWGSVAAGTSGLVKATSLDTRGYGSAYGGEVSGFDFDATRLPDANSDDRTIHFALGAAEQALEQSGLLLAELDRERFGVVLGTCMGGMRSGEEWHRQLITHGVDGTDHTLLLRYQFDGATNALSARHRLYGPKTTISTACAAGANAIGYASDLIRFGKADYMLAGGSDSLAHLAYAGFSSLQSLGPQPCSPYSKGRAGLTLGEGAGVVVLERLDVALERGATVFAEVLGYGLSVDGYHPTAPHPKGDGAARAIRAALKASRTDPEDVGYINGHGTGTPKNDSAETNAVKAAFGAHANALPLSSTKSMVGHSLGAAGAVEGITTMLALHHQYIPPTINFHGVDPELDLDYTPNAGRPAPIDVAVSNSFAFGGNNAVVVYGRPNELRPTAPEPGHERVVVTGLGVISAAGLGKDALWAAVRGGKRLVGPPRTFPAGQLPVDVAAEVPDFDATAYVSAREARRMDVSSKYAIVASKMALDDAALTVEDANRDRIGIVAGTGNGPSEAATSFHQPLVEDGPSAANPAIFPNTVFNAAAGQVAIRLGLHGCTSTVTAERASAASGMTYAFDLLRRDLNDAIVCVSMDELDQVSMAAYNGLGVASADPRPFGRDKRRFRAQRRGGCHRPGDTQERESQGRAHLRRDRRVRDDLGCRADRPARHPGRAGGSRHERGAVPSGAGREGAGVHLRQRQRKPRGRPGRSPRHTPRARRGRHARAREHPQGGHRRVVGMHRGNGGGGGADGPTGGVPPAHRRAARAGAGLRAQPRHWSRGQSSHRLVHGQRRRLRRQQHQPGLPAPGHPRDHQRDDKGRLT